LSGEQARPLTPPPERAAVVYEARVGGRTFRVEVRGKDGRYAVKLDDRALEVDCEESSDGFVSLLIDGRSHEAALERRPGGYAVGLRGGTVIVELASPSSAGAPRAGTAVAARLTAPMPGRVIRVLVEPGQIVERADGLVVVEAMKMENALRAPRDGVVRAVHVEAGDAVAPGRTLVELE
jgi:biotin carboxyl carrier protein